MNGQNKRKGQQSGRTTVCGVAQRLARITRLSFPVIQCARVAGRHGVPVFRIEQRETGRVRQGYEAARMVQRNDHSQGQARITRGRISLRNQEGPQAEQGKLVCPDMADAGLVTRDGYSACRLHAECLSENKFRPPENGVEGHRIAPENGVGTLSATPENGAIRHFLIPLSTPYSGVYLDVAICTRTTSEGINHG